MPLAAPYPFEIPVACLLLAVALVAWPVAGHHGRRARRVGRRSSGTWALTAGRVVGVTAGACGLVAATAAAGPSGLLAAAMVLATAVVLVGRMLAQRRRRRALPEILRGLRSLNRELRSGTDPPAAAQGAAAACSGAGARVLDCLVLLMLTGDAGPSAVGRPSDDPSDRVLSFLRSGWQLSRRHGVAFGRVVTGIADELSDQLASDQARSAQLAGPRMSGYVMAALPLMGVLLGAGMGVNPVAVLLGSPLGNLLLVVGVALMCGGLLWSDRIVGR